MSPDGTERIQLTYNDYFENYPVWSPDGQKIAFLTGFGTEGYLIAVLYLESGLVEELLSFDSYIAVPRLAWSPDSSHLAVGTGRPTVSSRIRLVNLEGVETEQYSVPSVEYPGSLDWSPDGRYILFAAKEELTAQNTDFDSVIAASFFRSWNLYALDMMTQEIIRITYSQYDELSPSYWP
jgi:Tol biopolymer transport system component